VVGKQGRMAARATAGAGRLDLIELPGRYEILRHIADGGMASVWCARDLVLGREIAIKLLADAYARDDVAVRRFEREARAAARVSAHRHVVSIYDVGEAPDGVPFIAMEYLAGGSVHDALRGGPVEPKLALRWLRETASALDYAHSRGVVHRDLKPGNLLLDDAATVHVADFGIARIANEASITVVGEVLGTAAYLPPEQALGRPATAEGDRYSLAVVAYELLTGSRPFGDNRLATLASSRAALRPPPASSRNPALPQAVDSVLARGMARVPSRRWATAGAFVDRLAATIAVDPPTVPAAAASAAIAGAPTTEFALLPTAATAPAPYARFRSSRSPRPLWTALLVALAVIAFAAGIASGVGSGTSTRARSRTDAAVTRPRRPRYVPSRTTAAETTTARTQAATPPATPAAPAQTTPATPGSVAPSAPGPGPPGHFAHHHGRGPGSPPWHWGHPWHDGPVGGGAS
jgi:hypothetical protein